MNIDKYLAIVKKFFKKYLRILSYTTFLMILGITLFYTYNNVYKTAISPKKIEDSEIIAKKQKVDINLFKEIEKKIQTKNENSVENISKILN